MLRTVLGSFDGVDVAGLSRVALLNRRDTKYLFCVDALEGLLAALAPHYRLLDIGGVRLFSYQNVYFDTEAFDLYRQHHNGKRNRYKVRTRRYADTGACFNELKFKNNKGMTVKSRLPRTRYLTHMDGEFASFIAARSPLRPSGLRPVLDVVFKRVTLAEKGGMDRVTIDTDLAFAAGGRGVRLPRLCILELKQDRSRHRSHAKDAVRGLGIQPSGCSKYCLGVSSVHRSVKRNNFKVLKRRIDKLTVQREKDTVWMFSAC